MTTLLEILERWLDAQEATTLSTWKRQTPHGPRCSILVHRRGQDALRAMAGSLVEAVGILLSENPAPTEDGE